MNIFKFIKSRSTISVALSVVLSMVFVAAAVNAATTISTNIVTGGNITAEGTMGVGSTTPWGLMSVESTSSAGADTPIFVVGDQGTSTPMFYIGGNTGNVGIGTSSPSATGLGVVGDVYISSGLGVGTVETTDGRLTVLTDAGIGTTSASAVGLSVVGDGYFSSGLGAGTVVTTDGRIIADIDFAVASTSLWGQVSIEAGSLTGDAPIFVIGDQGTSTPFIIVDGNDGGVGIATTSSQEVLNVGGDASFGSAATTTILIDSSGTDTQGACLQMKGSEGTMYRAYLVATTSSNGVVASWQIEAGNCQ